MKERYYDQGNTKSGFCMGGGIVDTHLFCMVQQYL